MSRLKGIVEVYTLVCESGCCSTSDYYAKIVLADSGKTVMESRADFETSDEAEEWIDEQHPNLQIEYERFDDS